MLLRYFSYFTFIAALLVVAGCSVVLPESTDKPLQVKDTKLHPAKGMLLVARRGLPDKRFRQSVILIVQHGQGGTLGLIINRPSPLTLSHLRPNMNVEDRKLYYGGPVARRMLFFLVKSPKPLERTERVIDDILAGGSQKTMTELISSGMGNDKLRLYSGHTGWAMGQLEKEITRGDWHLVPPDPKAVFNENPKALWKELIEGLDPAGIMAEREKAYPVS